MIGHIFKHFKQQLENDQAISFANETILKTEDDLRECQIITFLTGLLFPFYQFMAPIRAAREERGEDAGSNVTMTILSRSLKISKRYHKDVHEACINLIQYF